MSSAAPRTPASQRERSKSSVPIVIELQGPPFEKIQCELPEKELIFHAWKGYREGRSKRNGLNPQRCMRHARWIVGEERLCTQHAGMRILEVLKVNKP